MHDIYLEPKEGTCMEFALDNICHSSEGVYIC